MADQILKKLTSFINFGKDGFKYNLETFPDTMTAAAFLFTILFQSPPLGALTGSILVLNVITPIVTKFLSGFVGDSAVVSREASQTCSGHFPGVSFERILQLSDKKMFGDLEHNGFPSYYALFLGFISAYVGALPIIYSKEIEYSPKRQASTTTGLVILSLVVILCALFRIFSTCETPLSLVVGLVGGAMIGLFCVLFLAFISERRLTNILSFPLIRNRAADGKPIYVCERAIKKTKCIKPATQGQANMLVDMRKILEKGSRAIGIAISSDKIDAYLNYMTTIPMPPSQSDQSNMLNILGVTLEQSQQIAAAGMKP